VTLATFIFPSAQRDQEALLVAGATSPDAIRDLDNFHYAKPYASMLSYSYANPYTPPRPRAE